MCVFWVLTVHSGADTQGRKMSDPQTVQPVHALAQLLAELGAMHREQGAAQCKQLEVLHD